VKQQYHQLQIIWNHIASPIEIPAETRKRLADLLGELLSVYWQVSKGDRNKKEGGNKHDQQNQC
jgi:hypothetical protein